MTTRTVLVACALVLAVPNVAFPQPDVAALESSEVCKRFGCGKLDTWALRDGGTNRSYALHVKPSVSLEAPTKGAAIASYGLVFYDRPKLSAKDLEIVWALIRSLHPGGDTPAARTFVQSQIETPVFQIVKAKTMVIGPSRIWVGKVGQEQIVRIQRDTPALAKPAFTQVGHQGMTYLVVVNPEQARSDAGLLAIARYLSNEEIRTGGRGEIFVWVWTDARKAARRIPMTDAQSDAMVAQVHINPSKKIERVQRSH